MQYFKAGEDVEFVLTENQKVTYEKHNHVSKYVAGLVLKGKVELLKNECATEIMQEDFFIIPTYQVHALKIEDATARILTLCIDEKFLDSHSMEEGKSILANIMLSLHEKQIIEEKQEAAYLDAYEIITKLHEERKKLPELIESITNMVVDEPEQAWNLDELADSIYINKYYMIRKFKETIGLTPHSFHIQNRIRKAQHLLQEGHSITDTALEMGFFDQSHFDKAFRKILGISPSEYVASLKKLS